MTAKLRCKLHKNSACMRYHSQTDYPGGLAPVTRAAKTVPADCPGRWLSCLTSQPMHSMSTPCYVRAARMEARKRKSSQDCWSGDCEETWEIVTGGQTRAATVADTQGSRPQLIEATLAKGLRLEDFNICIRVGLHGKTTDLPAVDLQWGHFRDPNRGVGYVLLNVSGAAVVGVIGSRLLLYPKFVPHVMQLGSLKFTTVQYVGVGLLQCMAFHCLSW